MISLQKNKIFSNDYITKSLFFLQCLENKERTEEIFLFISFVFYKIYILFKVLYGGRKKLNNNLTVINCLFSYLKGVWNIENDKYVILSNEYVTKTAVIAHSIHKVHSINALLYNL